MQRRTGFGRHKLPEAPLSPRSEWEARSREMLSRVLNHRNTVVFVGAGCSAALGYPTWSGLTRAVIEHTLDAVRAASGPDNPQADLDRLARFQESFTVGSVPADQMMFMLGACQRMYEKYFVEAGQARFGETLRRILSEPDPATRPVHNPYQVLAKFGAFHRFITSNYDPQMELALRDLPPTGRDILEPTRADAERQRYGAPIVFTQTPRYYEQLALFVLGHVDDGENMVFHCHGSLEEPASLIVTERDYQRWYLAENTPGGADFRQTFDLLFGSNPILFVGFSLSDDDLLRQLRTFTASNQDNTRMRPVFALFPERMTGDPERNTIELERRRDVYEFMSERYGIHVIPYSEPQTDDAVERGRALCTALEELRTGWHQWRDNWLEKPLIRMVDVPVRRPEPYYHYFFAPQPVETFGGPRIDEMIRVLRERIEDEKVRLIVIDGSGGSGKSWYALKLLQSYEHSRAFDGYFFWSSYYANDSLTALDRALSYLDPDYKGSNEDRVSRFRKCLRNGRYLLVFDGIERFLKASSEQVFTPGSENFLDAMFDDESKSTVIVTTRVRPDVFPEGKPYIWHEHIRPLGVEDIIGVEPFRSHLERSDVSALCSLVDGHAYSLVLAADLIQRTDPARRHDRAHEIRRALSSTPLDGRSQRMVRIALEAAKEYWGRISDEFIERLSMFMTPVADAVLTVAYHDALTSIPDPYQPRIEAWRANADDRDQPLLRDLVERRLVHQIRGSHGVTAYAAHPIVRTYIHQRIHGATTDALPNFSLAGFSARSAELYPGYPLAARKVEVLFTRLHDEASSLVTSGNQSSASEESAVQLCRAAFSVLRSRMELNMAPRWGDYDRYLRLVLKLANLAKNVSPDTWDYAEARDINLVEARNGPLYADELAWVYNEIGLACYAEGAMLDALAVWEQGHEINRVVNSYPRGGTYLFQSYINLGTAYIHYGRLNRAQHYLNLAEEITMRWQKDGQRPDDEQYGRVRGYQAQVEHLRGNLDTADRMYSEAIGLVRAAGNRRAEAIFLRHQGDLLLKLEKPDDAIAQIQSSRFIAENGHYRELVAAARMSRAHWHRYKHEYRQANQEANSALLVARRIGMRRLESEVLSEMSRIALDLGDAQTARRHALTSLRIANELSLGLRQTHDLLVLGLATVAAGSRRLGIGYLRLAKRLADHQEYWLRAHEAEEALRNLGGEDNASEDEDEASESGRF
jgi:tetratricopeptide (TPR) repeat protein